MDGFLKQSTAAQVRWIGPFVDDTDFKTAETGLTVANTDIKVSKNGGASASKNSGGGTHDVNGYYAVTWDATDTATVGQLSYSVKVAGALQVFGAYTVLEEVIYDALFAASATGALPVSSGGIAAAAFAAGAIDAAALAADASTEINTAVLAILGTPAGASMSADIAAIEAQTDDIGAAGAGLTAADDAILTILGTPAGVSLAADIAAIEAQTDDIGAAGAGLTAITGLLPAALVGGRIDASVGAMAANVLTATAINADAITDAKVAADVTIASVTGAVGSVTGAVGSVTGAVGSVTGSVGSVTGNVGGNVTGSVGSVVGAVGSVTGAVGSVAAGGITAASIATGAIDADALAADAVDEILDETIGDGTLTMRQALRVLIAGMAGKLSGAATTTVTIRNAADSANVIVATVDADGNRSAVTVTP